jgi:hypothetical protein
VNIKVNYHGLTAIVFTILILSATILKLSDMYALIYGGLAIGGYTILVFGTIRDKEELMNDKRRIISEQERFDIFRRLIGLHIMAGLSFVGQLIPFNSPIILVWLVISVVAGFGIPYIILQRSDS